VSAVASCGRRYVALSVVEEIAQEQQADNTTIGNIAHILFDIHFTNPRVFSSGGCPAYSYMIFIHVGYTRRRGWGGVRNAGQAGDNRVSDTGSLSEQARHVRVRRPRTRRAQEILFQSECWIQ
jgi:hypothetical protein